MPSDASTRERVAPTAGLDEDRWVGDNGKDTFVDIASTINGMATKTRWWTSYWFNVEKDHGYYVWGDTGDKDKPKFDCIFDPGQSVEQAELYNGVALKVKLNGDKAPYAAELVLEGIKYGDWQSHPGLGYYAVQVAGEDLGELDPNVLLGIFTYQFGASAGDPNTENVHREIDLLETMAGSQQTGDQHNAQFAVQPASGDRNGLRNGKRFTLPKKTYGATTFMRLTKQSGESTPSLSLRVYNAWPTMDEMIKDEDGQKALGSWSVKPSPLLRERLNERLHINFYVPGGKTGGRLPRSNQTVLVRHFEYKSPETASAAKP